MPAFLVGNMLQKAPRFLYLQTLNSGDIMHLL